MTSRYHHEKVRNALAYIAAKLPERQNMYKVLKVIYFADKCHLRKYGRVIFGETYLAMKHGPVPRSAYRKVTNERDRYADGDPLYSVEDDHTIRPLAEADLDYFSQSDVECINEEIEACRSLTFAQLKRRSHDSAYNAAGEDDVMSIESIAKAAAESSQERERLLQHLEDA